MTRLLNAALLIAALLTGYGLTLYLDRGEARLGVSIEHKALPEFSFTDINGDKHAIADFKGKTIIINFWATWCPPCVVEFPALLKIAAQNPDVILIALSSDKSADDIRKFLQQRAVPTDNVLIALDPEDVTLKLFGVSKLPETVIAGPGLEQRQKLVGAEWDPATLQKIIDSLKP